MGGCIFAFLTGAVSLVWSVSPGLLLDWFTSDPQVSEAGRQYLVIVGPAFAFQGIGSLCASQRKRWQRSPASHRNLSPIFIAVGAGFIGIRFMDLGLSYLFTCLSIAGVVYGLIAMSSLSFAGGG